MVRGELADSSKARNPHVAGWLEVGSSNVGILIEPGLEAWKGLLRNLGRWEKLGESGFVIVRLAKGDSISPELMMCEIDPALEFKDGDDLEVPRLILVGLLAGDRNAVLLISTDNLGVEGADEAAEEEREESAELKGEKLGIESIDLGLDFGVEKSRGASSRFVTSKDLTCGLLSFSDSKSAKLVEGEELAEEQMERGESEGELSSELRSVRYSSRVLSFT